MLPVQWRASARADLMAILAFITEDSPGAARKMKRLVSEATLSAARHPEWFRPGRVAGTRELVISANYILVYRVMVTHLEVVSVLHARREYPRG
ncbi:type II toxin-antitoxin system RelE/ParE family toxin [Orrella dioscoreae]|uniref:type II toxin-antitoxin system RelE/ParE family toxin n=1 Tax=Orrella dioscoreae TaxID=1851544 RepID=UPI0008353571|nr:type II toxin-antitoxin system mRNA interferase toxin, RelE/StbE family [Orrella dioscoreae]